jgi:hypothetical protein
VITTGLSPPVKLGPVRRHMRPDAALDESGLSAHSTTGVLLLRDRISEELAIVGQYLRQYWDSPHIRQIHLIGARIEVGVSPRQTICQKDVSDSRPRSGCCVTKREQES